MLVPEAAVNEDYLLLGAEDKVRLAWHVTIVESIAVAHAMHDTAHDHLRLRISITNT
jgi:hypothetical protein